MRSRRRKTLSATSLISRVCRMRRINAKHASDNRVELERARHAIALAQEGRTVAVISGGDPGIFAMASAVFEAIDGRSVCAQNLDVQVVPGISAMQVAAARLGAPLGHDFCAISLSDNLKPWPLVAQGGCEPRRKATSSSRYTIRHRRHVRHRSSTRSPLLQRNQGRQHPRRFRSRDRALPMRMWSTTTLADADCSIVDMATLVIIGSSETRVISRAGRTPWVYTPRHVRAA